MRSATERVVPSRRSSVAAPLPCGRRLATAAGRCAAPETSAALPSARHMIATAAASSRPERQQRALMLRGRQYLDRHLGEGGQRAEAARQQLAEVVARDVLHHPPAGLEDLALAVDGERAQEMIARRSRLRAARAGEIAGQHAAQRPLPRRHPIERPQIRRLEGQHLTLGRQRLLDLGQARAGAGGQHQLLRFIETDAGEMRQVETLAAVDGPSQPALAARAQELQRAGALQHGGGELRRRSRLQGRRHQKRGSSGCGSFPPLICSRPISAQRCSWGKTLPGFSRP